MDVCILTNDSLVGRFIVLELEDFGYTAVVSDKAIEGCLHICDLDSPFPSTGVDIGFSYDESKSDLVSTFLRRPISAYELQKAVDKHLAKQVGKKSTCIEIDLKTRKIKSENGSARLSEKELALFRLLCEVQILTREDGAAIFGDGDSNVVDVYMHYLRKKLSRMHIDHAIKSKRGAGYSLSEEISVKFI